MGIDFKKTLSIVAGGLIVVALAYVLLSTPVVHIYPKAVSIEGNESVPVVVTFGGLVGIVDKKVSSPYIETTLVSADVGGRWWRLKFDADSNLPNGEYDVIISVRAPYIPFFQDNTVVVHVNRWGVK